MTKPSIKKMPVARKKSAEKKPMVQGKPAEHKKHAEQQKMAAAQASNQAPSIEVHIPASAEYVRVARLAVTGVASRMSFSYEDIEDIKLAVAEACNNAILHACPPANAVSNSSSQLPSILIKVTPYADRLEISISDEGRAESADFKDAARLAVSRQDDLDAELPESGFGLLLIQSLMDTVEHHADAVSNTTIRMTKYMRNPDGAKAAR